MFDIIPEAICLLDVSTCSLQYANAKFCSTVADSSKFKGLPFLENFISREDHSRFEVAIKLVASLRVDLTPSVTIHTDEYLFNQHSLFFSRRAIKRVVRMQRWGPTWTPG